MLADAVAGASLGTELGEPFVHERGATRQRNLGRADREDRPFDVDLATARGASREVHGAVQDRIGFVRARDDDVFEILGGTVALNPTRAAHRAVRMTEARAA